MSTGYHEQNLSPAVQDRHRALASLQEELEATDWYSQRVDVADDEELKAVLEHNMNEELEHASMVLEWLRRRTPVLDQHLRTYLFTSGSITAVEEGEGEGDGQAQQKQSGQDLGIAGMG